MIGNREQQRIRRVPWTAIAILTPLLSVAAPAQNPAPSLELTQQKIQQLTDALARTQAQVDTYQQQLQEMRKQLTALQQQLAAEKAVSEKATSQPVSHPAAGVSKSDLDELRERQAIQEAQIATHEQTKVETESKYPLKVSGLLLLNGYVNTRQVDNSAAPTYALTGSGSTGLSVRQTVLGLDALGPHLFGAISHADARVDFFADGVQSGYTAAGLLRLRTAHAGLTWQNTEVLFEQDRSLLAPNVPSSLVAVAQPEFSWSGSLWTWNPQLILSHKIGITPTSHLEFEGGFIDPADPLAPGATASSSAASRSERSRWPGTEVRIAFGAGGRTSRDYFDQADSKQGLELGVSGYFSPHRTADDVRFDAWAAAIDWHIPLSKGFGLTGNAYRGAALGGLGGGGFVDVVHKYAGSVETVRALDDVGGWLQLQSQVNERLQFSGGYGIDNPFANQIRVSTTIPEYSKYFGLARNRSAFGNVIYSPSTYLLFSLEYRRLWSDYPIGPTNFSDVIGLGAGYRF